VAFYTQIAAATSAHLMPRRFGANWDPDTNTWHILLEDFSESHILATRPAGSTPDSAMDLVE
jgi:hypothetical protein